MLSPYKLAKAFFLKWARGEQGAVSENFYINMNQ